MLIMHSTRNGYVDEEKTINYFIATLLYNNLSCLNATVGTRCYYVL